MTRFGFALLALAVLCIAGSDAALAHTEVGVAGGLQSGFLHPLLGPDHLIAMVAVGLWGAQLGMPLVLALPVAFPLMMAVGGVLGVLGVPLPAIELGIAASAIVLGVVVALALRPNLWVAIAIVAVFAIFHGHAHGAELPEAANPLAYGVGFVVATGLLHLLGILLGRLRAWQPSWQPAGHPMGARIVQACGGVVALLGGYYLVSNLTATA